MTSTALQKYQLSAQQRRLWRLYERGWEIYAQCALSLRGPVDTQRLQQAVYQLVSRFEIFRTGFEILQGMDLPLQAISEVPKLVFQIAPAEKIEGVDRESFLHELLTQERAAGLDFQEGPFVRACLVRVSRNESLLAITLLSLCADTLTLRRLPFDL